MNITPPPPRNEIERERIDSLIDAGSFGEAQAALCRFWRESQTGGSASFIVGRFETIKSRIPLVRARVAILRSFTVEPIVPLFRAAAFTGGIDLTVRVGAFNAYSQEAIDPASELYAFRPDIIIVAVEADSAAPDLVHGFAQLTPAEVADRADQGLQMFTQVVSSLRRNTNAQILLHTLQLPIAPASGVLDAQSPSSQTAVIATINTALAALARTDTNVYLLDINNLIARRGWQNWHDAGKASAVALPIAASEMIQLAREWMRFIHPMTGRVCKVLVTDLDNTLWGGVIGEDGIDHIGIGPGPRGGPFVAVQRVMKDFQRRGILLAVCSKNNANDALAAFERHPDMLLRAEDFAAFRINWQDKATNLRELAAELNLGLDAFAFLDDNPAEREWVRSQLPEVTVIDLPDRPIGFADALRDTPVFERLALSEEDRSRATYYTQDRQRLALQESAGTLEDFYRSLDMQVHIASFNARNIGRAAQLTQKTNQFNMTTRRYTEAQIASLLEPDWRTYVVSVKDRFGDNGIVGLALVRNGGVDATIDTLLLSCRVIGRTVETALLAQIAQDAADFGAKRIVADFIATKKNLPAMHFYRQHGFELIAEGGGAETWALSMNPNPVRVPPWIALTRDNPEEDSNA